MAFASLPPPLPLWEGLSEQRGAAERVGLGSID